jgi:hypothetical protein
MRVTAKQKAQLLNGLLARRKHIGNDFVKCNVKRFSELTTALEELKAMYTELDAFKLNVLNGITYARQFKDFQRLKQLVNDSGATEKLLYFYFVELKSQIQIQHSENALAMDDIINDLAKLYQVSLHIANFANEAIKGKDMANRQIQYAYEID